MTVFTITDGDYKARIAELGAELLSFERISDKAQFLWCGDPSVWGKTSPVLFPFAGLLRDKEFTHRGKTYQSERHGFARTMTFKGEQLSKNSVNFTLASNAETLNLYPFSFTLKKTLTLKNNCLSVEFTVINDGNETMYYGIGGHTAFATEGGDGFNDSTLTFNNSGDYYCTMLSHEGLTVPEKRLVFSGNRLPLSTKLFDNDSLAFDNIISNEIILERGNGQKIGFSYNNLPALVLWATKGTNRFICLEPWTGVPERVDADKDIAKKPNLAALNTGASNTHSFTIKILK